jgi:hypothetical protein
MLVSPIRKIRIASLRVYMRGAFASAVVVVVVVMFSFLERCAQLCDAARGYASTSDFFRQPKGQNRPFACRKWLHAEF